MRELLDAFRDGHPPGGAEPLTGGFNNRVWALGGVCVKLYKVDDRPRADREWRALHLLGERFPGLAPRPLYVDTTTEPHGLVMELIEGVSLVRRPPDRAVLTALVSAIRAIESLRPDEVDHPYDVIGTAQMLIARTCAWAEGPTADADEPRARLSAMIRQWATTQDVARLTAPTRHVFGRGDPSIANCLWDGRAVRFIDLEYSGWGDPVLALAELVEAHPSRCVPDAEWDWLVEQLAPEPTRYAAARRFAALNWGWLRARSLDAGLPVDDLAQSVARCERVLHATR